MRFSPGARACTTQAALHAAIGFIAGFEDDTGQSGVTELLDLLQHAAAQPVNLPPDAIVLAPRERAPVRWVGQMNAYYWGGGNIQRRHANSCAPYWVGSEERKAVLGGEAWHSANRYYVPDSFGDLVEVRQ